MALSEEYILNAVYTFGKDPRYDRYNQTYNCGCPICREGNSWGKKKRLFYYPSTKSFYCFNCSESWSAKKWIHLVSGLSYEEIEMESCNQEFSKEVFSVEKIRNLKQSPIPLDSMNLFDKVQSEYYKNNKWFNLAIETIETRRLKTAINACKTFYLSLTDKYHKNRLVIPFFDKKGKIIFYQTRSLDGSDPRYLGKYGSDKTVFGIDRINPDLEYIFIFEGPIDSMFVQNGVAVAGLTLTKTQESQLKEYPFHKKIWVLDNISVTKEKETKSKVLSLLNSSQKVYRWNNTKYKDFNEWAVSEKLDEIPYSKILESLF